MTMPRGEMPYNSPEEACQAAQQSCIRERGHFCEAYDGVNCKDCPKYKEGIQRRKKRFTEEEKQTICSVILEDNTRFRLRGNKDYVRLEVGKFFDQPRLFIAERSIVFAREEVSVVKELMAMLKT